MTQQLLHLYLRVSAAAQAEKGHSLEDQRLAGEAYAERLGLKPVICEEGAAAASKEDLSNRPVMKKLLEGIRRGEVSQLWVYNQDRLSRNRDTAYRISYELFKHNVVLHTPAGAYDFDNHQDRLTFEIFQAVAAYDNDLRRERTRTGKLNAGKKGLFIGGATPFGTIVENKRLVLHPEESNWVKQIFAWYSDGTSIKKIQEKLLDAGVATRRGNPMWSTGSIRKLLSNSHYVGFYEIRDKEKGETFPILRPELQCVDRKAWDGIQENFKKRAALRQRNNRTKHLYLLHNVLYCARCGTLMGARFKTGKAALNKYFCKKGQSDWRKTRVPEDQKWKRGRSCSMNRALYRPIADELVWKAVVDTVKKSSICKEEVKSPELARKWLGSEETRARQKSATERLERLQKEKKKYVDGLAHTEVRLMIGDGDTDVIQATLKVLSEKKAGVDDLIQLQELHINALSNTGRWINWLEKHEKNIADLETADETTKKAFIESIVERVDVDLREDGQHTLSIQFRMPIVDDGIRYKDPTNKSPGYELEDGTYQFVIDDQTTTSKGGRPPKKKDYGPLIGSRKNPTEPLESVTVE